MLNCLSTFLANLSVAAGLCAAWHHGYSLGFDLGWEDYRRTAGIVPLSPPDDDWRPGCHRPAPGFDNARGGG